MDILLDIIHIIDYDTLLLILQRLRGGSSDTLWTLISFLGNYGAVWIILSAALLFFPKTRRAGAAILLALLIGLLVGNIFLKELVMRPRPFVTHPDLIALFDPGDEWSFPSGHALSSFAAAAALCFYHRKSSILAFLLAAAIAFSRLYACVHYPSDVLAGALIGILCGLLAGWLTDCFIDLIHTIRLRNADE